jgi:hypothetical protein
MVGELPLRGVGAAPSTAGASAPRSPALARPSLARSGARRGAKLVQYGGTLRVPSTPARAARSALAVNTFVNSPG